MYDKSIDKDSGMCLQLKTKKKLMLRLGKITIVFYFIELEHLKPLNIYYQKNKWMSKGHLF